MVSIKTVAVLGGTGNLGPFIVQELVAAGFTVTGVTRAGSTNSTPKFPDGLAIKSVDYESVADLTAAFAGQDAVVSVVATAGIAAQKVAVDAAVAAGVRRFVPSEFGINTRRVGGTPIGAILAGKIAIVDYLKEQAAAHPAFSWTGLSTGLFFDWALERGTLGFSVKDKTAIVVDSGNEKWQASNLPQIGQAVAGILSHPDATANQYLGSASFNLSQNELIALVEELAGTKLAVTRVASADIQKKGEEKLAQGDFRAFIDFLHVHNFADGAGNALAPADSANELVGLPYEDLRATVESWLKKAGAL
ncbi:hypothetical protein B0T26DRAFT_831993 [Lasiosphaeria miniovina]|uniref:NmrA-like domain-containing protein n=1 Tax=Lasiosphaeria miniovina TaxID=1954250 RepID=A0AA40ABK5_9PEZI|nr:uncharacterized protein B0T26DRAFT_831993 [Lasiosphaeria miniovina]KAK0712832.1 hypothetical protein B0T26DRAFT_831993 [Lasiosphaeria miniovina]